jgi:hypothetical protein
MSNWTFYITYNPAHYLVGEENYGRAENKLTPLLYNPMDQKDQIKRSANQ